MQKFWFLLLFTHCTYTHVQGNFAVRANCVAECVDKAFGYKIPDDTDCMSYLLCYGNMVIQQHCELGKVFNEQKQKCIAGKCPPCKSVQATTLIPTTTPSATTPSATPSTTTPSGTPSTTTPSGTPSTTTPPATPSTTTPSGTPSTTTPSATPSTTTPSGTPSTTTTTATIDPYTPDCTKHKHGDRLPHEMHCNLFWQCVHDRAVLLFCEKGLWWDRKRFVCNFPYLVKDCPIGKD